MVSLLIPMEMAVRRIARFQGGTTRWITMKTLVRCTRHCFNPIRYTLALLGAQFARKSPGGESIYQIKRFLGHSTARRSALCRRIPLRNRSAFALNQVRTVMQVFPPAADHCRLQQVTLHFPLSILHSL